MRRSVRRLAILVLSALLAGAASAQPQQAGKLSASAVLNSTALHPGQRVLLAVIIDVEKGYHAQSHKPVGKDDIKLELELEDNALVEFGAGVYPPGEEREYEGLGKLSVYTGRMVVYVPLEISQQAAPGDLRIAGEVHYQVCDDKGSCFPPAKARFEVASKVVAADQPASAHRPELFAAYKPAATQPSATRPATRPTAAAQPPPTGRLVWRDYSDGALRDAQRQAHRAGGLHRKLVRQLPVRRWDRLSRSRRDQRAVRSTMSCSSKAMSHTTRRRRIPC